MWSKYCWHGESDHPALRPFIKTGRIFKTPVGDYVTFSSVNEQSETEGSVSDANDFPRITKFMEVYF